MTSEQKELVYNIQNSIIKAIVNINAEQMWELIEKAFEQKIEKKPCEDCISREEAIKIVFPYVDGDLIADAIKHLPSVTPKQKVGKWIDTGIGKEELYGEMFVCSECNGVSYYENYCPNCGADMREGEE